MVQWDLDYLSQAVFDWISSPILLDISLVGTLSSHTFSQLINGLLGRSTAANFRRLICSASLAYTLSSDASEIGDLTPDDLRRVSYLAGCSLLNALDLYFSPASLARCSHKVIQALFLVCFGTILSVGYTSPLLGSPAFPSGIDDDSATTDRSPTLWDAMREHLCQQLAHHLAYLGSTIGLKFEPKVEESLLKMAVLEWLPQGNFTWTMGSLLSSPFELQPDSCFNLLPSEDSFVFTTCDAAGM